MSKRLYFQQRRSLFRQQGLCLDCGRESPKFVQCLKCRIRTMMERERRRNAIHQNQENQA